jgi:ketopantoate reductase
MFRTIQNIVAILAGCDNGKLFESKKRKGRRRAAVKDLVSISDEARERFLSDVDESDKRTDQTGREMI